MKILMHINNFMNGVTEFLFTPLSEKLQGKKFLDQLNPVVTTTFLVIFLPQMVFLFDASPAEVFGTSLLIYLGSFFGQGVMLLKKIQLKQWGLTTMNLGSFIPLSYCCYKLSVLKYLLTYS